MHTIPPTMTTTMILHQTIRKTTRVFVSSRQKTTISKPAKSHGVRRSRRNSARNSITRFYTILVRVDRTTEKRTETTRETEATTQKNERRLNDFNGSVALGLGRRFLGGGCCIGVRLCLWTGFSSNQSASTHAISCCISNVIRLCLQSPLLLWPFPYSKNKQTLGLVRVGKGYSLLNICFHEGLICVFLLNKFAKCCKYSWLCVRHTYVCHDLFDYNDDDLVDHLRASIESNSRLNFRSVRGLTKNSKCCKAFWVILFWN